MPANGKRTLSKRLKSTQGLPRCSSILCSLACLFVLDDEFFIVSLIRVADGVRYNLLMHVLLIVF